MPKSKSQLTTRTTRRPARSGPELSGDIGDRPDKERPPIVFTEDPPVVIEAERTADAQSDSKSSTRTRLISVAALVSVAALIGGVTDAWGMASDVRAAFTPHVTATVTPLVPASDVFADEAVKLPVRVENTSHDDVRAGRLDVGGTPCGPVIDVKAGAAKTVTCGVSGAELAGRKRITLKDSDGSSIDDPSEMLRITVLPTPCPAMTFSSGVDSAPTTAQQFASRWNAAVDSLGATAACKPLGASWHVDPDHPSRVGSQSSMVIRSSAGELRSVTLTLAFKPGASNDQLNEDRVRGIFSAVISSSRQAQVDRQRSWTHACTDDARFATAKVEDGKDVIFTATPCQT